MIKKKFKNKKKDSKKFKYQQHKKDGLFTTKLTFKKRKKKKLEINKAKGKKKEVLGC